MYCNQIVKVFFTDFKASILELYSERTTAKKNEDIILLRVYVVLKKINQ